MGYSLVIGELDVIKNEEDAIECSGLSFWAKGEHHENSPAFGDPTDFTNERWPSYSVWSNALEFAGLHDVFFSGGILIGGHPGVRLITKELVDKVNSAKESLEKEHTGLVAKYNSGDENANYCRILWLHYWVNWALNNCETPVIANN